MEWDLKAFLEEQIGYEEPLKHRKNMFAKLCRLYQRHGEPVARIIAETWAEACDRIPRDKQTHFFVRAVKLRLIDAKMWIEPKRFDGMELADILKDPIFKNRMKLPLFEKDQPPPRPKGANSPDLVAEANELRRKNGLPPL